MLNDKKKLAYKGLVWNILDKGGNHVFVFLINIILARMLAPSDFGLIGMIVIFTAVAQSFVDSGFTSALIQRQNPNDEDYSTVFYFNIFIASFFSIIIFLLAPIISNFYHEPRLIDITRLMSLSFVINSLGMIQIVIFTKEIDFKSLAKVNLTSIICSGFIGILLAYLGFGYWSLVIRSFLNSLFTTILLWSLSNWRPLFSFNLKSLSSLFSFGSRLLISGLLYKMFSYINNVIIGKYWAKDLGFYTQAQQLQQIPVMNLSIIFGNVSYPLLSSIQSDEESFKNGFRKTISAISLFNFPIMIGMLAAADSMILSIFTLKWANSIPLLRLLCISGLFFPINVACLNALNAKGRSDIVLNLEFMKQVLLIISIILTVKFGIYALLVGGIFVSFTSYLISIFITGKFIRYRLTEHFNDILSTFLSAAFMGGVVVLIGKILNGNDFIKLLVQVLMGITIYLLLIYIFKVKAFQEIIIILKEIRRNIASNYS